MKIETIIKHIESECRKKSTDLDQLVQHLETKCKSLMINLDRSTNNIYQIRNIQDVIDIPYHKVSNMPDNNVKWFCYYIKYAQYRINTIKEIKSKWSFLDLNDEKKYKLILLKEKIKFG